MPSWDHHLSESEYIALRDRLLEALHALIKTTLGYDADEADLGGTKLTTKGVLVATVDRTPPAVSAVVRTWTGSNTQFITTEQGRFKVRYYTTGSSDDSDDGGELVAFLVTEAPQCDPALI